MGAGQPRDKGDDSEGRQRPWQVEIDATAKSELATAAIHYELNRDGLGERFREAVSELIAKISEHPTLYQRLTGVHHRAVMRVFPFTIYFAVHKKMRRILILSIHHGKRHPKHWRRRKPDWRF